MMDNRGQSVAIIRFLAIFVFAAALFGLLAMPAQIITDKALNSTSNATAEQDINDLKTVWDNVLIFPLILGALSLLAIGVFQSRVR
jgi:archaellum component FlaG (FlaF/FlaG flagellin family)